MWLNADDVKFRSQAAATPSDVSASGGSRVWRRCGIAASRSRSRSRSQSLHVTKPGSVEGGRAIPVTLATNTGIALNELSRNFMDTGKSSTVGLLRVTSTLFGGWLSWTSIQAVKVFLSFWCTEVTKLDQNCFEHVLFSSWHYNRIKLVQYGHKSLVLVLCVLCCLKTWNVVSQQ